MHFSKHEFVNSEIYECLTNEKHHCIYITSTDLHTNFTVHCFGTKMLIMEIKHTNSFLQRKIDEKVYLIKSKMQMHCLILNGYF